MYVCMCIKEIFDETQNKKYFGLFFDFTKMFITSFSNSGDFASSRLAIADWSYTPQENLRQVLGS